MDFNNNKKSFEELMREKVEHHEFPFEANSWAAMQSKLQAHQAQAAATQTTLYKSILLKTGKILVGVISGSAIVYSTLSLTGMLDKKESAVNHNKPQQEVVLQKDADKPADKAANAGNIAMLHVAGDQSVTNNAASAGNVSSKDFAAQQNIASKGHSAANPKHFPVKGYMQKEDVLKKDLLAAQNSVKTNVADKTADNNIATEKTAKAINAETSGSKNSKNDLQNKADVNTAKGEAENTYIALEKNASANKDVITSDVTAKESATKQDAVTASVEEAKEDVLAAGADVDSTLALSNMNGGKYPEKPSVNKPASKIGIIASVGTNVNWLSRKQDGSYMLDIVSTPMFGLHAAVPLSRKVAVQAGAQYVSHDVRNVSHTSALVQYAILQDSTVTRTSITQAKYIEFPLLVKYALIPRVNIYTGLRTSLLISAKASVTQEQYVNNRLMTPTPAEEGNKFAKNGLRSVDFGIPLGVEVIASKRISVAANYNLGLSDFTIDEIFDNPLNKNQKDKHSSWQLQLNFKLF